MKIVKKTLAAAAISVACGSAMASSVSPTGTIDVYDGMSVSNMFTSTTFSSNDPTYYELNVTDSNGAQTYFSLIDTDNDFHDVTYTLSYDLDGVLNSIDIGSQFFQKIITDNNLPGPQGTFSQFLAAGQYVLTIATNNAFSSHSQVSAVPLPAAAWLFGSALLGMGFFRRRKQVAAV